MNFNLQNNYKAKLGNKAAHTYIALCDDINVKINNLKK